MKFFVNIFGKSVEKFKFRRNLNIVTGTLCEGLRIFIITSCCIHPRMRNFSGIKCGEKKHFSQNISLFFFKEIMWKKLTEGYKRTLRTCNTLLFHGKNDYATALNIIIKIRYKMREIC